MVCATASAVKDSSVACIYAPSHVLRCIYNTAVVYAVKVATVRLYATDARKFGWLCKSYIVDIMIFAYRLMTPHDVPSVSPCIAWIRIILRIQWIRIHIEKSLFEENCEPNL